MLAMVPGFEFPGAEWVSLALATPVFFWAAWPFHAAAARNLRHGVATMDTLISMGVLAAYGWSVYALIWGSPGSDEMYFEVAAGVTLFILTGRNDVDRILKRYGLPTAKPIEPGE